MTSKEEITHQQDLLVIYRRTLAHQVRRAGQFGGEAFAPPEVANSIHDVRKNIRRIKHWLREQGALVEDQLNDEPGVEINEAVKPLTSGVPSYVFNGPFNIGQANIGGEQTIEEMKVNMGDNINLSGANISNANINIKSKLENVSQNIGTLPQADDATKKALEQLVTQLQGELAKVSDPKLAEDAEKVANRTDAMVKEAAKPKPDKELIEFNAESLKKAAGNIQAVLPTVLAIATQIVQHIQKLVP